jgi:hypothetical protein
MIDLKECAFRIDPVLWVQKVLGEDPKGWQRTFLRAPRGASILALTARQVGKTTAACRAMAHTAIYQPGSLSVVACPAQRQSAEAIRRVRDSVEKAGAALIVQNVYGLELENGARVLALPGTDDSVRGLTVDGWIVADEAARLSPDLIAALRPMRARKPQARFAMLSTAWNRTDPFWTAWDSDDHSFIRLKVTADIDASFSRQIFSIKNVGRSVKIASNANISASPQAERQAPSPGIYMSVQPNRIIHWPQQGRPLRPPMRRHPSQLPTPFNV